MSLVDFPELLWSAIGPDEMAKISEYMEIISSCTSMKQLVHVNFSDDYVVKMKPKTTKKEANIWILLLDKLECFNENRPNENVILCEIILELLTNFKIDSTQTLQWAIYILQLNQAKVLDKNKAKSKQWSDKLNKVKQKSGMVRRKLDLTAPVRKRKSDDETMNMTTTMMDNSYVNAAKKKVQQQQHPSD